MRQRVGDELAAIRLPADAVDVLDNLVLLESCGSCDVNVQRDSRAHPDPTAK